MECNLDIVLTKEEENELKPPQQGMAFQTRPRADMVYFVVYPRLYLRMDIGFNYAVQKFEMSIAETR